MSDIKKYIEDECPLLFAEVEKAIEEGTFNPFVPMLPELKSLIESIVGNVDPDEVVQFTLDRAEETLRARQSKQ